jgi:excisionase family DNA binding protein
MNDTYLSVDEVADLLRHDRKTILAWIKSGRLKATRPGRKYMIEQRHLMEFLKQNSVIKIINNIKIIDNPVESVMKTPPFS